LSYFDTPSIPTQAASRNWSLNAVQSLGKTWAIFGRANTARGAVYPIKSSYAVGVAMSDSVKRAATDQIAVVAGYSEVASPPVNPAGARDEKLLEVYWSWTLIGGLLLTPSAQVTFDPVPTEVRYPFHMKHGCWAGASIRARTAAAKKETKERGPDRDRRKGRTAQSTIGDRHSHNQRRKHCGGTYCTADAYLK